MFDERLSMERYGFRRTSRNFPVTFAIYLMVTYVVFIFLLGTASFLLSRMVKTLPADFPAGAIMAVIMALLLTYSPIYTFFV